MPVLHRFFQKNEEKIFINSFYKGSIISDTKEKDIIRKENYREISLMNMAPKSLIKYLQIKSRKILKRIIHNGQMEFILEMQD